MKTLWTLALCLLSLTWAQAQVLIVNSTTGAQACTSYDEHWNPLPIQWYNVYAGWPVSAMQTLYTTGETTLSYVPVPNVSQVRLTAAPGTMLWFLPGYHYFSLLQGSVRVTVQRTPFSQSKLTIYFPTGNAQIKNASFELAANGSLTVFSGQVDMIIFQADRVVQTSLRKGQSYRHIPTMPVIGPTLP